MTPPTHPYWKIPIFFFSLTLPLATRVYYHPNHPLLRGISGTINTPRAHCEGAWHILEHPGAGPGAVKR